MLSLFMLVSLVSTRSIEFGQPVRHLLDPLYSLFIKRVKVVTVDIDLGEDRPVLLD
jgi:hypothetical protein